MEEMSKPYCITNGLAGGRRSVGHGGEEVEQLTAEAIQFHLEGMREEGIEIPLPSSFAGSIEIQHPA